MFLHTVPFQHPKTLMMNTVELIKKALRFGQPPPSTQRVATCCNILVYVPFDLLQILKRLYFYLVMLDRSLGPKYWFICRHKGNPAKRDTEIANVRQDQCDAACIELSGKR